LVAPERSPSPPKVITDSDRIGAEEEIDDYKGLTEDQIRELISKREAKANAQILEMVGDIPDAEAKPPENVLFVCKLNPVTTDEDLEIIFSRFGAICSCEVIRDQKTGDSLQYAFIEFENEEDCTKAYFKMDNVLIDDRRIHVDFSQSLAKVKGISRRKYSEEDPKEEGKKREDGLVARKKTADDGYEMVFGDDGGGAEEEERPKRREDGGGSKARRDHAKGEEHPRGERRDKRRGNDDERRHDRRDGGRERRERKEDSRERQRRHSRSRSRSHDRHSRSKHHARHKRDRDSRSRSRDRHHHRRH
jgi:peptidyl-prolyl cis-trans isomerase-like 4